MSSTSVSAEELLAFVERIEQGLSEKKSAAEHVKDVYAEAVGSGFDKKILQKIVALRAKPDSDNSEEEALLEMYKEALNMK
jgi:uncharacterized protein (UPF0335 family)